MSFYKKSNYQPLVQLCLTGLITLMRLNNLTNIALSEIMCCAESTISGYRTGRRVPDIFVICHLSTIFGVTPNYFLGFTDEICPTHN